jgi:hypothetical protein
MIRGFLNFLAFSAFVVLLPIFCAAAWRWGSPDEQWLMKVAFCVLSPICVDFWYIVASHLVFGRRSSYLVQFLIFVAGYAGVFLLLRSGIILF